ncbi:MAG: ECF transporter S component [Firmicutes bacterium ZCTH02-B6]|nr:MAG: ECF transporter S component [Firmicutes bacterium ZCTH02-B6]
MQFSTLTIVLIPVAIGVNYVGKLIAAALKLPLWLDSIGTVLAAMLAGPWVGAISGAANNVIFGLTADPISFWYLITSIAIGFVVGYMAFTGWVSSFGRAVGLGLIVGIVATVVSTPINVILWEGQTGNVWGDALYAYLVGSGWPIWLASFLDELVVDIPDKLATVIVSYLILRALPERLATLFAGGRDQVERL